MDLGKNTELINKIVSVISELKGENIAILDFTKKENSIADFFVICTGTSNTHINAISSKIEKEIRLQIKDRPMHTEGNGISDWVLLDYVNVIVHIFTDEIRHYYKLESLWGDVEKIEINE